MPDKEPMKMMSSSAEQWLYQGDCEKCRRSSYCGKPCKHHKNYLRGDKHEEDLL